MPTLLHIERCHSTNAYLQERFKENPEAFKTGCGVLSDEQTAGRGQMGNTWHSETTANLNYSLWHRPDSLKASDSFRLSQQTALICVDFLNELGIHACIKWPNDLFFGDLKIGGILIENTLSGNHVDHSILGIGINLNNPSFPKSLTHAVSAFQITGERYDCLRCGQRLHNILQQGLSSTFKQEDHDRYMDCLYRKEGYHTYRDQTGAFQARILSIAPSGHLLLETDRAERKTFAFKEVEFVLPVL